MWFLIKSIGGTLVLLFLAYGMFFVDLGGKTLAAHCADVWESPALQQKIFLLRSGVRNELEDRLAAAAERQTRKVVRESLGPDGGDVHGARGEINDVDRESLAKMIVAD